jgi:hypothetical protein
MLGHTALTALTPLECGVPGNNFGIQKAAGVVRAHAPKADATYELALTVLFLDRLGDPNDNALIQACALKLVAGQTPSGGWSYRCPTLNSSKQHQLRTTLRHLNPMPELLLPRNELALAKLTVMDPKDLTRLRMSDAGPIERAVSRPGGGERSNDVARIKADDGKDLPRAKGDDKKGPSPLKGDDPGPLDLAMGKGGPPSGRSTARAAGPSSRLASSSSQRSARASASQRPHPGRSRRGTTSS